MSTTSTATSEFKLGKLPARPDAVSFKLTKYLEPRLLPTPPTHFGHDSGVAPWQMLGNDRVGDCVIAGGLHETMLWTKNGSHEAAVSTEAAITNYSAITGYVPGQPDTDKGTDMAVAASYRRHTGLADASGHRHKIAAYLALTPGDVQEHLLAMYLFGAIGVGVKFPESAMQQFRDHQPWDVVPGSPIEGGHYIPAVARRSGHFVIVTWGREQAMTDAFLQEYNDESYAYVSKEYLRQGRSPEGFNMTQLRADLAALN